MSEKYVGMTVCELVCMSVYLCMPLVVGARSRSSIKAKQKRAAAERGKTKNNNYVNVMDCAK